MATVSVTLSEPECEHAATKSIKRPLHSYTTEYEPPPAVKIKPTNPLNRSFLPASISAGPAEDSAFSDTEVSNTKEISSVQTNYGHRLIPQLIDERARLNPQGSVWSVPKSSNLADGFRDISYGQVARAINRVAWWIDEQIGKSTTFEKLAFIGPSDLRYSILTIAAQKTGHTVCRTFRKTYTGNLLTLSRRSSHPIGTAQRRTCTFSNLQIAKSLSLQALSRPLSLPCWQSARCESL